MALNWLIQNSDEADARASTHKVPECELLKQKRNDGFVALYFTWCQSPQNRLQSELAVLLPVDNTLFNRCKSCSVCPILHAPAFSQSSTFWWQQKRFMSAPSPWCAWFSSLATCCEIAPQLSQADMKCMLSAPTPPPGPAESGKGLQAEHVEQALAVLCEGGKGFRSGEFGGGGHHLRSGRVDKDRV